MKKLIKLLAILCLIVSFTACKKDKDLIEEEEAAANTHDIAQNRSCGLNDHMKELLSDPAYRKKHEAKFTRLANSSFTRDANCSNPTILPVAVHFQGISNPDASCLRQLAETQIAIINADYQGNNGDITNWDNGSSSSFPGVNNGDACLEFCLASQNHPSGFGLNDGDPAVTINQTTGDFSGAWANYINIFVRANTGVLGYSPLGGSGNGDGVVVDAAAFGSGAGCGAVAPQSPYNLGRTLTHELGHYLLLDHMWGNGGCNSDDQVSDTPNSTQPYYGCPSVGQSSCGSTDMHMSYMDYTNDACMYMFSEGQVSRAENYVATSLQNVAGNAAAVCGGGGGSTPTCSDGIQNGNETGVDCGGSCPPCESEPTCSDGIQNGNETGVDCGGSCPPCQTNDECETPENVIADVLSSSSAMISWNSVANAQSYKLRYKEQGTNNWTTIQTTDPYALISGLNPSTTYRYKVRSICGGGNKSPFSAAQKFTTPGNNSDDCDATLLYFDLVLDDYGSETTWELVSEYGSIVAEGGPYQDGADGTLITDAWCLEEGCYEFVIYDAYGDGICCDYGEGFYTISDAYGNILVASDGYFGTVESVKICITNGFTGDVEKNSSARLPNGNRGQKLKMK